MEIAVRRMEEEDLERWDAFVSIHPEGTFCHRAGWKAVIEEGADQKPVFLLAEHEGVIVGILPLAHRKSLLFGSALISTMFAVYGGPLASSNEAYKALDAAAWAYAVKEGIPTLEYRSICGRHKNCDGWQIDDPKSATFRGKLQADRDSILAAIPRKQRAVVRKSLKIGLTCSWEKNIDIFYDLYAESVKNLGTPVFPKKLFQTFVKVFEKDVEIQIIHAPNGDAIASLMSFYHGDYVLPYYAGGNASARKYGGHDYMYFNLMLRAIERGKTKFDFGRSKVDTGPYNFKKNWGFEPTPLEYEAHLADGAVLGDLSPANQKFELVVKMWKRLPLPVANFLGPRIARHLG